MSPPPPNITVNGYQLQPIPLAPEDPNKENLKAAHVKVVEDKMTVEELGQLYASIATTSPTWSDNITYYRNEASNY